MPWIPTNTVDECVSPCFILHLVDESGKDSDVHDPTTEVEVDIIYRDDEANLEVKKPKTMESPR